MKPANFSQTQVFLRWGAASLRSPPVSVRNRRDLVGGSALGQRPIAGLNVRAPTADD